MKQIFEKTKLIPSWARVLFCTLTIGVLLFCVAWAAGHKDYDKAVALAALLVAIMSAPFFSVRAEMEKHLFMISADRKQKAYQEMMAAITKCQAFRILETNAKTEQERAEQAQKKLQAKSVLLETYIMNDLFFSDEVIKELKPLIQEIALKPKSDKIKPLQTKVKKIMRKELGL